MLKLSAVVIVVIINLIVLSNCASDVDEGKLIFAQVVSFLYRVRVIELHIHKYVNNRNDEIKLPDDL